MHVWPLVFSQIMDLLPLTIFRRCVARHQPFDLKMDRHVDRGFMIAVWHRDDAAR
jgi:hypothetical protein